MEMLLGDKVCQFMDTGFSYQSGQIGDHYLYWACGFSDSVHQIWHNFQPRGVAHTCAPRCKWVQLSHWNYKHPL